VVYDIVGIQRHSVIKIGQINELVLTTVIDIYKQDCNSTYYYFKVTGKSDTMDNIV